MSSPFGLGRKLACSRQRIAVGQRSASGKSLGRIVAMSSKCCGEISPHKSASVYECVRSRRYKVFAECYLMKTTVFMNWLFAVNPRMGLMIPCDLTDQLSAGQRWTATRDEDHIAVLVRVQIRGQRRPLRMLRSAPNAHRAECLVSRHSKSAGRRTRSGSAEVLVQQAGECRAVLLHRTDTDAGNRQ